MPNMVQKCQNKHIERKNSGVLKFFDLSASDLSDAAEPKYFPTRLHIYQVSIKKLPPFALYSNEFIF